MSSKPIFQTVHELKDYLVEQGHNKRSSLICLDGDIAAGKSTIARELSKSIDSRLIEGDLFLSKSSGKYVDNLNINALSRALNLAH